MMDVRHEMPPAATGETPVRPYGPLGLALSTVLILIVAAAVCALIAAATFGIAALALGIAGAKQVLHDFNPTIPSDPDFIKLNITVGLVAYAVVIGAILAAARLHGEAQWRDLVGWRPWHPFRRSWLFWGLLIVTLAYSIGADRLVTYLHPEASDWVPSPSGPAWDVLFLMLVAVLAPIAEELMFRGWIYTSLRASIGVPAGIILSAALFGLAHWEKTHLYALAIFPVGLALGIMREKTGSIAASIAFHGLYNAFASALLLTR